MTPFWPAHLSSLGRAFVHHSNHALIRTFSSNSLASSSTTMTIHMSAQSPLTNLHAASGWLTIFKIGCHMNGTNLDSTHQCLVVHLPGSLIRSIHIFCNCAMQTAKSFHQISLLLQRPQSRHSLMALSALAFPHGRDGSKHILMTQSCAQFGTLR